jgi:hypothetical protein
MLLAVTTPIVLVAHANAAPGVRAWADAEAAALASAPGSGANAGTIALILQTKHDTVKNTISSIH